MNLDLVETLKSPLLPTLAPEFIPFREKAEIIVKEVKSGCTSCEKRAQYAKLVALEIEMKNILTPELRSVLPTLLRSARGVRT